MKKRPASTPKATPPPDANQAPGDGLLADVESARRRLLGPFLAVTLTLNLLVSLAWLGLMISSHMDVSFPEGSVAERALAVARGASAYSDWRAWPHQFAPYGPLTYYPVGWLGRLAAARPSPRLITMLGRWQSALSLLAMGWLAIAMARRAGMSRLWAWLGACVAMTWAWLFYYCLSYRPDAPAAALAMGALLLATLGPATPRRAAAALTLLMLSMWLKPTAFGYVIVIGWWMTEGLGWRRATLGVGAWMALGLAAALALDAHWHGLLLLNMAGGNRQGFSLNYLADTLHQAGKLEYLIMLAGAAAAAMALRRPSDGSPQAHATRQLARAALAVFAVSLALCLKIGADVNYFLPPFPLLTLMATLEAMRLWRDEWRVSPAAREALLWLVLTPAIALPTGQLLADARGALLSGAKAREPLPIARRLDWARGSMILTTHPFLPMELDGAPTLMDYFCYSQLSRQGLIDVAPLRQRIESGAFTAIVVDKDGWENRGVDPSGKLDLFYKGCFDQIARHYRVRESLGMFVVLEPAPK